MGRGVVGLDVGTTGVRGAQVSTRRSPPVLERIEEVALPPGAVADGRVVDADTVAEALGELWRKGRFSSRRVRLGVANPWVAVQLVDLPVLQPKELRGSLRRLVADQLPVAVDEVELDCIALRELATGGGRRLRALAVAADRGMLADLVTAVRKARLRPVGIDLAPLALMRALRPGNGGDVVVEVGAHATSVLVRDAGMPAHVWLLPVGGDQITQALVDRLGLTAETAEAAKHAIAPARTHGSAAGQWVNLRPPAPAGWCYPRGGGAAPPAVYRPERWGGAAAVVTAEGVDRTVDETLIRLAEQVGSVLADYRARDDDPVGVERVVLTGGGSRCGGMARWLAAATALPVEYARPFGLLDPGRRLRNRPDRLQELEAVAGVPVGLALGDPC